MQPSAPAAAPVAAGTPARVSLRILGDFALHVGDTEVAPQAWRRSHARRLLQYLGSSPRGSETRRKLQQVLWPEFDDARARNRLHHTLHWVRKAFDELAPPLRPRIAVEDERVQLLLPAGAWLDWTVHTAELETDEGEPARRLALLQATLAHHRGELAADWTGQSDIDARRTWLAERRDKALLEAIGLAQETGDSEAAVALARQRARALPDDMAAQRDYALLLCDSGRAEAALLHCTHLRPQLERDEPALLPQLDQITRLIQQHNNRAAASPPPPVPMLVSRLALPAPRAPMVGYGSLVTACRPLLQDAGTSALTLVGPPGAGKSLLAAQVAHRWQGEFRHGAIELDLAGCDTPLAAEQALGRALEPLVGRACDTPAALQAALSGKELLIVVEGLPAQPRERLAPLLRLTARCAELKWLVTAREPLAVRGERTLRVEPALLLDAKEAGAPTPAALLLASTLPATASEGPVLAAAPPWALLEQIAQLCDGLPGALQVAADRLELMAPAELIARLHSDPGAVLRGCGGPGRRARGFASELDEWLAAALPHERHTLAVLASCRSWLTREDVQSLHGGSNDELDAFIELGIRRHHLRRRVRSTERGPRSEFRVPRLLLAAAGLALGEADRADIAECIAVWIERGPVTRLPAAPGDASGWPAAAGGAAWFDERLADVDQVVERWLAEGAVARLEAFCAEHAAAWSLTRHPGAVLRWLNAALDAGPPPSDAALLLARAGLRLRVQQEEAACDDARRALLLLGGSAGGDGLRQRAIVLLQRHERGSQPAAANAGALGERGIEAAEALMQVARLAVQRGRYAHALAVCQQCVALFERFQLVHGQVKALRYHARIALASGQLEVAEASLAAAEAVGPLSQPSAVQARIELFRAEIDLNRMAWASALDRTRQVLGRPEAAVQDVLAAHGLYLAAWVHQARGEWPLALGLCREAHRLALGSRHSRLLCGAHVLEASIAARQGERETALQHISAAFGWLDGDRQAADLQFELINAAELAAWFGRSALALRLLAALQGFGAAAGQALRPWIAQRQQHLRGSLGAAGADLAADADPLLGPAEGLRQLMQA